MFAADTASTITMAEKLKLIDSASCEKLQSAHKLYVDFMQISRMTVEGVFDPAQTPESVKRRISLAAGLPDFRTLEGALAEMRIAVRAIFNEVLGSQ